MSFERTFSGAPWEKKAGYCRALRAGQHIFVSGTAPVADDGSVFAPGDAYAQTRRCFEIVEKALQKLGADVSHVVRTRMYVTDVSRWQDYTRAHNEIFGAHPPTTALLGIKELIDPDMLVEVEAEAICEK
ncbi:RidA family protein [candidate division KSB1 bacterium]|nr:RidA family protein [candidate division KSB1 bacterium]